GRDRRHARPRTTRGTSRCARSAGHPSRRNERARPSRSESPPRAALYDGAVMEALLFDFDGTLVDTESVCLRAWEEVYRRHGVVLSFERWQHGSGTLDGFDEFGHLEELLGAQVDRDAVGREYRSRELELMASEPLRAGVAEYLDDARRLGLALGIVSSSSNA